MLTKLTATTTKSNKRLGRGYGSGKGGHTSSRGQKGQKSRGKVPLYFEGSKMRKSLIRRMPMLRGKLKFKSLKANETIIFNLKDLNGLPAGTVVDVPSLIKHGFLPASAEKARVKILGEGDLKHKLTINLPMSKAAAKKVGAVKPKAKVKKKK